MREEWAANGLVKAYAFLAKKLSESASKFVVGDSLTIADFYAYNILKSVRSGTYDFVPADSDAAFPIFEEYINSLENVPAFKPFKY